MDAHTAGAEAEPGQRRADICYSDVKRVAVGVDAGGPCADEANSEFQCDEGRAQELEVDESSLDSDCSVEIISNPDVVAWARGGVCRTAHLVVVHSLRGQIVEFGHVGTVGFYGDFIDDDSWFRAFERVAGILC
jgi:hypothetical protein